jgi:CRP-like cAMP-binding protein
MQSILGFCQGLAEQSFSAGAVWLREGEQTGRLYILIEGSVEIL